MLGALRLTVGVFVRGAVRDTVVRLLGKLGVTLGERELPVERGVAVRLSELVERGEGARKKDGCLTEVSVRDGTDVRVRVSGAVAVWGAEWVRVAGVATSPRIPVWLGDAGRPRLRSMRSSSLRVFTAASGRIDTLRKRALREVGL